MHPGRRRMTGRALCKIIGALAVACALLVPAAAQGKPRCADCYEVGVATRSINPDPDGSFAGKPVYLGGYGLGSPPVSEGRPATRILGEGVSVRAVALSDGREGMAVADIETQG